ncbi:succinylglutamate desuccinylase/aspartoacylase family protein [Methanopyrus kandleri]|uniref:Metal-dependent hydrolase of the aminoacylase-2/carboxypeptidase Z family n=2 Tax=Methanopyrus kandleri TaxID=2320 RepID=Q8TV05_METKA|nr:succinylglutamate desuccinylase/aspartoacylase family protein [Methanopyrus kandleri]AAM02809.1 Metal-dependent hydrolase of the aminoacylase-2/carboxypeptidase Z family [Methanopyrus kandleri AV19]HII71069.1 succinylglutamate desuccinylase/aspartoacylase family protein [Methanopyrus kandleri]
MIAVLLVLLALPTSGCCEAVWTVYDWGSKGNILKNPVLVQHAPHGPRSEVVYRHSVEGTVVFEFRGGPGPAVLLTAGVHGDEVWTVIALLKLLDALSPTSVIGTVYVIPAVNPAGLAANSRLVDGVDPNRTADIPGSLTWHLVRFALSHRVKYWLDMHCGSGVPRQGALLTDEESEFVDELARSSGFVPLVKSAPRGSIRSVARRFGIDVITLEVPRDAGPSGVERAYHAALAFLRLTGALRRGQSRTPASGSANVTVPVLPAIVPRRRLG